MSTASRVRPAIDPLSTRLSMRPPPLVLGPPSERPPQGSPKAPRKPLTRKDALNLRTALLFLAPNIIGFLAFTLVPLALSFVFAFTNWDLKLHNMYKSSPLEWVGVEQFSRLFREEEFLRYLGNTLFLMIGIPLGMAGSLGAALLLSANLRGQSKGEFRRIGLASVIAAAVMFVGVLLLWSVGAVASAMAVILGGVASLILVGAAYGGVTVYRTLFYLPHFTSGVAVFLLWKKLYSPLSGPINAGLAQPLATFSAFVNGLPSVLVQGVGLLLFAAAGLVFALLFARLTRMWHDGEAGSATIAAAVVLTLAPVALSFLWASSSAFAPSSESFSLASPAVLLSALAFGVLVLYGRRLREPRDFTCSKGYGSGTVATLAVLCMVFQFVLIGLGIWAIHLPGMAAAPSGITPPNWLTDFHWAKPAIMLMGLWAAIGSNNMLLYLAGLTNIPQELYEAADIDGARPLQRFWHVTWPQLAPVTFFIFVMSVIGGLQGGFEMARTMTNGGPAGATTTLAYYIYTEGFQQGRLGFASAVAWTLFALVFVMTLINWKFGSRYVND